MVYRQPAGSSEKAKNVSKRWWTERGEDAARSVFANLRHLAGENKRVYENMQQDASIYGNRRIRGLTARQYHKNVDDHKRRIISLNLTKSGIDSIVAKIAKNTPRASFVTDGADFALQQKAKRLDKFVEGVFYQNDVPQLGPVMARDAMVFHVGHLKVFARDKKVCIERVYPWELLVDPQEALYGNPRSLYQFKYVDRDVLTSMFPSAAGALKTADFQPVYAEDKELGEYLANQVTVVEAWHLPSGEGAGDGRHVVTVDGAVLLEEEYEVSAFPFVSLHWESPRPLLGVYGASAVHEVTGIQNEINHLIADIQERHHLMSKVWIITPRDNNHSILTNENGIEVEYDEGTTPPTVKTFQVAAPEIYEHLNQLKSDLFNTLGVSQLSAQAMKPAGLNSGKALRDFHDIETERFAIFARSYEEFFKDLAQTVVMVARQADDAGETITVSSATKRRRQTVVEKINWSEVSLADDLYELQVFPASKLPTDPAGRLATVEQLIAAQMISKQQGMALLEFPDVESALNLELAPYDTVLDQISMILDDGESVVPEPFQDVALALKIGQQAYMRAQIDRAPEERLELLRVYIDRAESLLSAAAPTGPEVPGGAAPVPPGAQGVPSGPGAAPMPGAPPVAA